MLNPYKSNGLSHPNQLDKSILDFRHVECFFIIIHFQLKFDKAFSKNSEDPYRTPYFAASDQDLHYWICSITKTFGLYVKLLDISMAYFLLFYNKIYTTLTNFSTKYLTMCMVYYMQVV